MYRHWFWLLTGLLLLLVACGSENASKGPILARINDHQLTLEEFEHQLAAEQDLDRNYKITAETKQEFLEQLIQKELLIQEAKRLQLDRQEKFIRAIERHWEATLIRDLMELKAKDSTLRVYITQEEIASYYQQMKADQAEVPPLDEVRDEITRRLMDVKKGQKLRHWIQELRNSADIDINMKLLKGN